MFSVFSSFNICARRKLHFSPSLLLLFALQTAALALPRWVAVPSESHFTKPLPCGLCILTMSVKFKRCKQAWDRAGLEDEFTAPGQTEIDAAAAGGYS